MGRPRAFDMDQAIDTAIRLFWEKGYEGTSLSDLTEAMGITPPSFYAAFGNKEGLFRLCLNHYNSSHMAYMGRALKAASVAELAGTILHGTADAVTDPGMPRGCFGVNNALPNAGEGVPIRLMLAESRQMTHELVSRRLTELGISDPEGLTRYLMTVSWGLAVEAQSGSSRADLHKVVDRALHHL